MRTSTATFFSVKSCGANSFVKGRLAILQLERFALCDGAVVGSAEQLQSGQVKFIDLLSIYGDIVASLKSCH